MRPHGGTPSRAFLIRSEEARSVAATHPPSTLGTRDLPVLELPPGLGANRVPTTAIEDEGDCRGVFQSGSRRLPMGVFLTKWC